MVHRLALKLSVFVASYIGWQDKTAILTYGFELIIGELFKFGLLIIVSAYFDLLTPTILILTAAIPYRLVSGGGHCTTYFRCTALTISTYFLLAVTADRALLYLNNKMALAVLPLVTITSFIVIHIWGPAENPNRTFTTDEKHKFRLLSKSFITLWVASCLIIYKFSLEYFKVFFVPTAVGVVWQTFFVSPLGNQFIYSMEKLFDLLKRTKEVN